MNNYGIADYTPPVAGKMRITSGQGNRASRRTTNGKMMSSFHHGVDIAGAKPGDKPPILNVTGGTVVYAGNAGGYGNTVIVKNPDGYIVQYAHLDSIGVKAGDQVPAGGQIGVMGGSGNVTGVHLDMIVVKDGKTLTPQGKVLAAAPASILRRSGGKAAPMLAETPTAPQPPADLMGLTEFTPMAQPSAAQQPTPVLAGALGLSVPRNETEAGIFSSIADMKLGGNLERIYAEAGRAISDAYNQVAAQPMLQSEGAPMMDKLSSLFDKL